jgi:hypothetical protein
LHMPERLCWQDPDIALSCESMPMPGKYRSGYPVIYWMDHRAPNEGARENTKGAKGVCNPIGGTTIWTNQLPPPAPQSCVSSCICSRECPSQPSMGGESLGNSKTICPSTGECQGQEAGVDGLGSKAGGGYRGLWG